MVDVAQRPQSLSLLSKAGRVKGRAGTLKCGIRAAKIPNPLYFKQLKTTTLNKIFCSDSIFITFCNYSAYNTFYKAFPHFNVPALLKGYFFINNER